MQNAKHSTIPQLYWTHKYSIHHLLNSAWISISIKASILSKVLPPSCSDFNYTYLVSLHKLETPEFRRFSSSILRHISLYWQNQMRWIFHSSVWIIISRENVPFKQKKKKSLFMTAPKNTSKMYFYLTQSGWDIKNEQCVLFQHKVRVFRFSS